MKNFVCISLINQKALPLARVGHFHGVLRDQRVEIGVERVRGEFLGTQNPSQSLCLLTPGTAMGADLDEHICFGQIKGGIGDLKWMFFH